MPQIRPVILASLLTMAACGGDDTCDPVAITGCDGTQVCENVEGGDPTCYEPVHIRGQVFDLDTSAAIPGARVVALDINGAAVSSVAVTDAEGNYDLNIPSTRNADGVPIGLEVTLRADAAGYQTYPGGLRQALPVDTGEAVVQDDGSYLLVSALTNIGLFVRTDAGTASISGHAEVPDDHAGILVVAEGAGAGSVVADRNGDYVIFNLPPGEYVVTAYAQGQNYVPGAATLAADSNAEVDLAISGEPASVINGDVSIVNPEEGNATSIILVVKSTFDSQLQRGATVPGLRAPTPGIAPDVTGAFTIEGVPAGSYYVLAAFENDGLVRDPDTCISGTDLVSQDVTVDAVIDVEDAFKVTGAIPIRSPGADGVEVMNTSPTFVFADDASAEEYHLVVVDAYGNEVWTHTEVDLGGGDKSVAYAGDALQSGMYYQYRVTSTKDNGGGTQCGLARTEDLKGVFYME